MVEYEYMVSEEVMWAVIIQGWKLCESVESYVICV